MKAPPLMNTPDLRSTRRGFSLVELLFVLAVISILAGFSMGGVASLTGAGNMRRSVEVVLGSAAAARQAAMTSGQPVAMVVSTEEPGILLLRGEFDRAGALTWAPLSPWENFPNRIGMRVFPREDSDSFYTESSPEGALTGALPARRGGAAVTAYSYIVFRPDGSVDAPKRAPSLGLRRLDKSGETDDFILLVSENSGRCKVIER